MKKTLIGLGLAFATILTPAAAAFAHHTFVMFNSDVQSYAEGIVLENNFNNPHVEFTIAIQDEDGEWQPWWFEAAAPAAISGRGTMTGDTLVPGDRIAFTYCQLRDGRPGGAIGWIRVVEGYQGRVADTETFHNPADGGCGGNAAAVENWTRWLEQGFTTSTEGQAWEEANPQPEEEAAPPA